jgi:hypothetical protein
VAKIKDLNPFRFDDTSTAAYRASFVAKHDNRIATDDEFICGEFLKFERLSQSLEVLLDLFAPAPRMRPRDVSDDWRKKFDIASDESQKRVYISLNEESVSTLHLLPVVLLRHQMLL